METTIIIEKELENLFRECTCQYNTMAITEVKELADYVQIKLESADDEHEFINDLFYLGRKFELGRMFIKGIKGD